MNASRPTLDCWLRTGGTRFRHPPGGHPSRPGTTLLLPARTVAARRRKVANLTPLTHCNVNQPHSSPFIGKNINLRAPNQSVKRILKLSSPLNEGMKREFAGVFGSSGPVVSPQPTPGHL